jgi:hypothetical protein
MRRGPVSADHNVILTALVAVALLAFLLATSRWVAWSAQLRQGSDAREYVMMARAAPGLPDIRIGSAHAERFAVHYAVGLLADGTGLSLATAYRLVALTCVIATVAALAMLMSRIGVGWPTRAFVLAVIVLNPYALRPSVMVTATVQDAVFVLALTIMLIGLFDRRAAVAAAGLGIAILARQTAILLIPPMALWMWFGTGWRDRRQPARILAAVLSALTGVALYVALIEFARRFDKPFAPGFPQDSILPVVGDPPRAQEVIPHVVRVLVPLIVPLALLIAALLGARPRKELAAIKAAPELWLSLLMCAAIVVQPLLITPSFPGFGHNEQRLSALGLVPCVVAIGVVLQDGFPGTLSGASRVVLVVALLAYSLHHVFSVPRLPDLQAFMLMQVGVAVVVMGLLISSSPRAAYSLDRAIRGHRDAK